MEKDEIINGLTDSVVNGKKDKAIELSNEAIKMGIDPYIAIVDGLAKGMEIMSKKYDEKQAFIPHLLMSSNAMYGGMDVLSPHLKLEGGSRRAVLIIGTVEGDVHDIGKNLVKTMMSAAGFEAIDLGKDVPIDQFVETAIEKKADIISVSTLMTSTMDNMQKVVQTVQQKGIRDKVKIIVGGAPVNEDFAKEIGADTYKKDAMLAAKWAKEVVETLQEDRWN